MKRAYELTAQHADTLVELLEVTQDMGPKEKQLVVGINDWCRRTKKITYRQMQTLGSLYKKYVHDSNYVHHDWPIWK